MPDIFFLEKGQDFDFWRLVLYSLHYAFIHSNDSMGAQDSRMSRRNIFLSSLRIKMKIKNGLNRVSSTSM